MTATTGAAAPTVTIRTMVEDDAPAIAAAFAAQRWNKPEAQYQRYFAEQKEGQRLVLIAVFEGTFAGYVTIVWRSEYPPFAAAAIPAIVDFNVLIRFRRRGIGTALMDEAERRIAARSPVAGIGVGMTEDYGAAQVLYVMRGYLPDGCGLFQGGHHLRYGDLAVVDDDLALYFTKQL